ncbi:MAG TPA: DUF4214 domain-containing protein [Pirellulales bacterium]|jgi:Ca2+-binding RTX toxin-like protein|nr:DUF4214 domain-containing protein [Pirellulales bacterium]
MEWLEERQLLTWVATFAQSTGTLTIQGVGLSSDTGVVKLDPNTGEILLDGNNSGNFVDTGANVSTINVPIQIEANTTLNSNFIIDNSSGGFFEASASYLAPAAYPAKTLFNYTGSTAFEPNSSLTIRGRAGVADTFTVNPDKTFQDTGVVTLTEPPNQLNQQLSLTVTYGYPPVAGAAANINATPGISGHLTLDGVDGAGGNDKLVVNDPTGVPSDWTLNGNEIAGPAFPTAPTVPPTPPTLPGTIGDITYANIANLQFNDAQAGDLLTINSVAANTAATTVGTTVVNYSQPLAFPINLIGGTQTTGGNGGGNTTSSILDIVGAPGGNNDFFVDDQSVSLAAAGTHPQYNTPFSHLGAGLTYTPGSLKELQVAGNGGDNTITVQVPPTLLPGFTSQTLPSTFVVYGGATPPPAQLIAVGVLPTPVTVGTDLLRVLGNAPGALTAGNDTITVSDFGGTTNTGGGGTTGANNIQMSRITAVVIYGEGGNDTLTNASTGIKAQGIPPVSGLLIGGSGNDTLVGGAGNDMLLGGDGQNTLTSSSVATLNSPTTTYFFPHQDPFGNIFDPFLNSANTTSTINAGTLGNQLVVTGVIANTGFKGVTGLPSDQDLGSLTSLTFPPGISGGLGTATVDLVPTVPPSNVTAPLYEATPALLALEQAIGEGSGPFPANEAALLEFGAKLDLRGPFASFAAFVGRAYDDFLVDRGGGGTFGGSNTGEGFAGGQGSAVVSNQEIQFWASQGLSVQQVQSQILGSDELRQTLPASDQWVRFLYQSVLGRDPTSAELTAYENVLNQGDTGAAR